MGGFSHVMNGILYKNTGYLSLPFHNIWKKKGGKGLAGMGIGDIHSQNRGGDNSALHLNTIPL